MNFQNPRTTPSGKKVRIVEERGGGEREKNAVHSRHHVPPAMPKGSECTPLSYSWLYQQLFRCEANSKF